jgi:hypothetical protein
MQLIFLLRNFFDFRVDFWVLISSSQWNFAGSFHARACTGVRPDSRVKASLLLLVLVSATGGILFVDVHYRI